MHFYLKYAPMRTLYQIVQHLNHMAFFRSKLIAFSFRGIVPPEVHHR
ncbi:hypothetical protein MHIR_DE00338 [Candidatus Doolittlea endobia]|uniref:Uncharacterized protein n=1 Tax=Candidatus Doolittlea endobia TaxID=1778262 RepID=A0A143WSC4_9ENTR|nr:hypothetical protein MHIR_DE00338 [Candidatus Doolittlea endobia]